MRCSTRQHSVFFLTRFWLKSLVLISCIVVLAEREAHANESTVWDALKSGNHFALLRHAIAPGTGDPANFDVTKCSTQRNLSLEGRNQADEIGNQFRANGIEELRVYSSQWCRCLETAQHLSLGPVQEFPALNSFFQAFERRAPQTEALKDWLAKQSLEEPILLVTHQVNITALTSAYTASGEIVVVRRSPSGELTVVGRIQTD